MTVLHFGKMTLGPVLYFSGGQIAFTSKYGGNTVTGLVGSSVRFTWSFTGDVNSVDWGLKKAGVNAIENNGVLVSLDKNDSLLVTVSSVYSGRVSGSGDVSSGHVIFTLTSIRRSDKGFYGCIIKPTDIFDLQKFDSVYLAVKGEYAFVITLDTNSGQNRASCKLKYAVSCSTEGVGLRRRKGDGKMIPLEIWLAKLARLLDAFPRSAT